MSEKSSQTRSSWGPTILLVFLYSLVPALIAVALYSERGQFQAQIAELSPQIEANNGHVRILFVYSDHVGGRFGGRQEEKIICEGVVDGRRWVLKSEEHPVPGEVWYIVVNSHGLPSLAGRVK